MNNTPSELPKALPSVDFVTGAEPPVCVCPGPGYCEQFKLHQMEYAYGICSGKGSPGRPCTKEKSEAYRRKWQQRLADPNIIQKPMVRRRTASTRDYKPTRSLSVEKGPGTKLKNILESLGVSASTGCKCRERMLAMNDWGVEECRRQREEILSWLRYEQSQRGWGTFFKAAFYAATTRFISITDPLGSILDEALRQAALEEESTMLWAYGVTTVPERRKDLLPRTLASLVQAGFPAPRLFVDGESNPLSWKEEFQLEVTTRYPQIRVHGNWVLALEELYIRQPSASRFAIFQDDFVTYRNLRPYLEQATRTEEKVYWNLYTFPMNQELAVDGTGQPVFGFYQSNQKGKGAVALVFTRQGVMDLLANRQLVDRPNDAKRGHKYIDGGVVHSLGSLGYKELVHNPSLVQHTGYVTPISPAGNRPHALAVSFRGEEFDALELLKDLRV